MALPVLESTWTHVNNTQLVYSTEANMTAQIFWRMTRALVACPSVTVRFSSSSSGSSATVDGVDRLTTFAEVQTRTTTVTSANTSFIVARMAGVHSTFDVCIAHCGSAASTISMSFSVGGNFVPAATTTHHPTATDILFSTTSTVGGIALTNTAANKRFHYSYTAAGDQLRFLVTTETTLTMCTLTDIGIVDGQYTSSWIGPEVHLSHYSATTGRVTDSSVKHRFGVTYSGGTSVNGNYWGYIFGTNTGSIVPSDNSNEWAISPLFGWSLLNTTQCPLICRFRDIFATNNVVTDGSYFPTAGTKEFIVMETFLLPWDGSTLL